MNRGVEQGDSLSPLHFIIIMDRIRKRKVERERDIGSDTIIGYRNMLPAKLNSLRYADDIIIAKIYL